MNGTIAFVGFGEAGQAFATGWSRSVGQVAAFDIKTDTSQTRAAMEARYASAGVTGADRIEAALDGAERVFCLVTADCALEAARAGAGSVAPGTLWFDGNSCAPDTKRAAAEVIEGAGGRYVDMAIMAPVAGKKHRVPILLSGPHADVALSALTALDMQVRVVGDTVGQASSIKMIRSVMIKGIEALTAECFLSARRAGVGAEVLGSFEASDPGMEWPSRAAYNFERMMVHGKRRAAEMREVAKTVEALGLGGGMAAATAAWQDRVADTQANPSGDDLWQEVDRVLNRL